MSSAPSSKCNYLEIASIILISFSLIFGISVICTIAAALEESYDEKYEDSLSPVEVACYVTGAICTILAAIATPLACCSARKHQRGRTDGQSGTSKVWMIASWVLYGIMWINSLSLIGTGAAGGDIQVGWVVAFVFWAIVGWALMITYAELVRRKNGVSNISPSRGAPFTADVEGYPMTMGQTIIEEVIHEDGSKTVTKTTTYRNGSKKVEITDVPS